MFCQKHPNLFADKRCSKCLKWVCYICSKVVNSKVFCAECAEKGYFFTFSEDDDFKESNNDDDFIGSKNPVNISNIDYQVSASLVGQGMMLPWKQKPAARKIPCAYHSYKEAYKKCSKCNQMVCKDCMRVDDAVDTICYVCWYKIPVSDEEMPQDEINDRQEEGEDEIFIEKNLSPEVASLLEEENNQEEKKFKKTREWLEKTEAKKKEDNHHKKEEKKEDTPAVQGKSQKTSKENLIYERGLFEETYGAKESWFVNLNLSEEEAEPSDNIVESKLSPAGEISLSETNELSDEIDIKDENIDKVNKYLQNILQAIETPSEENIKILQTEEKEEHIKFPPAEEEFGGETSSHDTKELTETDKVMIEKEDYLDEIDELLAKEEGLIEGDEFDLSEMDELLEDIDRGNTPSEVEELILSDNLLDTSSKEKEKTAPEENQNRVETLISKVENRNSTMEEKKETLEEMCKIEDSSVTEYIGNMVLHGDNKELRIKAAEMLAKRMDEDGLDYLMTGIKCETDSEVRKRIAWAYSRLKYKK